MRQKGRGIGTLVDAGPLFALSDPFGQPEAEESCRRVIAQIELPLITTTACLTEAFYLAARRGGWKGQTLIAEMLREDVLRLECPEQAARTEWLSRVLSLMEQYQDRPMDFADASLVALAEHRGYRSIFSLDSDFYIYRLADGRKLEVLPGESSR